MNTISLADIWLIGIVLSFFLFARMTGKHKVFGVFQKFDEAMNMIFLSIVMSLLWFIFVPIALFYWGIKNNHDI